MTELRWPLSCGIGWSFIYRPIFVSKIKVDNKTGEDLFNADSCIYLRVSILLKEKTKKIVEEPLFV